MNALYIIFIIVGALLGIAYIFALISKLAVWRSYVKGNGTPTENGLTGEEAATMLLEKLELSDVKVEKLSWFMASMYGNHYNARTKTIYLRNNILKKPTVTSVALAIQKVALAVQHKNEDKAFKLKSKLQPLIVLAPILFVPLALIGVVLDVALRGNIGVVSVIFLIIGLLFYLIAFIFTLINIPVEKNANKMALSIIKETNIIDASQHKLSEKIYKSYMVSYVADFIMSSLYLIYFILKVVLKVSLKK